MSDNDDELAANAEALDTAVRKYNAQNQGRGGVVTAWVLMTASNRYDDDGDMLFAYDYSVGAGSDMMRAIGLVRLATLKMEDHITHGFPSDDDDPGE